MPKEYSRMQRIEEMVQQEIARFIQRDIRDPRVGIVTVCLADVSPDLANARIHVSILGDAAKVKETLKVLNKAAGFLRCKLANSMKLRVTPALHFVYDASLLKAERLTSLINGLDVSESVDPEGDSLLA
jgi:ribosome-binding factor A